MILVCSLDPTMVCSSSWDDFHIEQYQCFVECDGLVSYIRDASAVCSAGVV